MGDLILRGSVATPQRKTPIRFNIPDMACDGCVQTVTRAITKLDPAAKVEADTQDRTIRVVTLRPSADIERSLTAAGYRPRLL
jgi:copper chaperone